MKKFFEAYSRYVNIHLALFGVAFALVLSQLESFRLWVVNLNSYGYLGAFVGGMLFVSTFTVGIGVVVLFILAQYLQPLEIGLVAGWGALVADYIIFCFIRNGLKDELVEVYKDVDRKGRLKKLVRSRRFGWALPILGAIIIASPLPDELGVGLLGISEVKTDHFLLLSYVLNFVGIFLVVSAAAVFHTSGV